MSTSSETSNPHADPLDDCPLPAGLQTRNLALLVVYWSVTYFCAPVGYVGPTQANLLKELGNSDTVCNLPSAAYLWLIVVPVVAAWWFPQPRFLRPLAIIAIAVEAAVAAFVAVTLWLDAPASVATAAVIAQAGVFGISNGVLMTVQWELMKRGISTSRRGRTLGFIYGVGPLFACLGALLQDSLFDGQMLGGRSFGVSFPVNYLMMFAAVAPLLLLKCASIAAFRLPAYEASRSSATTIAEIREGLHQFARNRIVWIAVIFYVVVYSGGNAIFSTASLHAADVLPDESDTLGMQSFLRFGSKAIAGALLGLLLARTNPRATLLATTGILVASMCWAIWSSGWWYMATFGLLGAGELFGAYYPNYITTASEKRFVRVNIAYMNVIGALTGFAAVAFGKISDWYGRIASFQVALCVLVAALVLIVILLPADPTVQEPDSAT